MGKGKKDSGSSGKGKDDDLIIKDDDQAYARVTRMLGGGRIEAFCFDGHLRQCVIRGNMRRRIWIAVGDIILVAKRSWQDSVADVVHRYNAEEVRRLQFMNEIPATDEENDEDIQFREESSDSDINVDDI